MAKLRPDAISASEIRSYVESTSDFAFELRVLRELRHLGISCEHGGLYEDPLTKKLREYDIRAAKDLDIYHVYAAVECKNIKENNPIVALCVPRHQSESYNEMVTTKQTRDRFASIQDNMINPKTDTLRISPEFSLYPQGRSVAKSITQVGRNLDGKLVGNDAEIFEKWGQSLSSIADLIETLATEVGRGKSRRLHLGIAFAFVVVPDNRLWKVNFDEDGNRLDEPSMIDTCSFYVGREYKYRAGGMTEKTFNLSHIEIVTLSGLRSFVQQYLIKKEDIYQIFKRKGVADAISRQERS